MASNKKLKVTPLKEDQVKDVAPLFKFLKQSNLVNSIKNKNTSSKFLRSVFIKLTLLKTLST